MSKHWRPSQETVALLIAERQRGVEIKQLARQFGCTEGSVGWWLRKLGVRPARGSGGGLPNEMRPRMPAVSMEDERRAARAVIAREIALAKAEWKTAPPNKAPITW
jgi:transposase-like protein